MEAKLSERNAVSLALFASVWVRILVTTPLFGLQILLVPAAVPQYL